MDFISVIEPIIDLINALVAPLLALVGAGGTLYCVLLGAKYAKAEEPQDKEKAKNSLKNAITGFLLIFVLIVVLNVALPLMTEWAETEAGVDDSISFSVDSSDADDDKSS